jgi:3-methyladenine DNA glycosylase AlkD
VDVKKFIKNSHDFYGEKKPEIKTLAVRLYEEYELNEFYNIFNKLWNSGYHSERVLAVETLELYKEEYDKETWRFLIPKIKEIRDFDESEKIGKIIGEMTIKYPNLKREILKISDRRNPYYRKIALSSCFPLIKNKDWNFIFMIIRKRIFDKEKDIIEFTGFLLKEIGKKNKMLVKKFIINNKNMNKEIFDIVLSSFSDFKKIKKLTNSENSNSLEWINSIK